MQPEGARNGLAPSAGSDTPLSIAPLPDLPAARSDWTRLAEQAGSPFSTWEWAAAWWRHRGAGRRLLLTAGRDPEGEAKVILPLYAATGRPLRALRFVGHGAGDQLGPVCAPEERPAAARALLGVLAEPPTGWDVFIGDGLPADGGFGALVGARVLRHEPSPVLPIEGTWDEFLASRSRNFRNQMGRRERKLAKEHQLKFRLTEQASELERDLDTLFALHAARWNEGESEAYRGPDGDLHREFAAEALRRGWLRLWFLELDGQPVAAWHGFRFGQAEWFYNSGRDPAWDGASVGLVLLVHTIREAMNEGMREYRFLRGGESYKSRFATADPGLETVALGRGLVGRAAVGAALGSRRLPSRGRRLLSRLAG